MGMGEVPDRLRADLMAAGATEGDRACLRFRRAMVDNAIGLATKTFVLQGRDERRLIDAISAKV
ncbi:MAG: hypothetical protein WA822_16005 [Albidovulum sp.]